MKTAIEIIAVCILLFLISQPTISWPPFRIHFDRIYLVIGIVLICIGSTFILVQGRSDVEMKAYEKGLKKGSELEHEAAIEAAKQIIKESQNPQQ